MIGYPTPGIVVSVLDAAGAILAPRATYCGPSHRYAQGTKLETRIFGLPGGKRLEVEDATHTLTAPALVNQG